jgi:preprotein translocase subunit SecF
MKILRWRWLLFTISGLVIIPGLISLVLFGFKPSIDFTGGSLLEVKVTPASNSSITSTLVDETVKEKFAFDDVSTTGSNQFLLRGKTISPETKQQVFGALSTLGTLEEVRFETVGPTLGKELLQKTLTALLLVSAIITWFVARQFKELKFGVSAILAMLHDTLVLLGVFSLLGHFAGVEVDVLFVTALLTTLSFSVHDTIVVFDRIRELQRKHRQIPLPEIANTAVLETMGRSLNNSLTIIFMLLALVLLGGESIKWFAVALLVGSITGTYSSTFTAVPLLLVWDELKAKRK